MGLEDLQLLGVNVPEVVELPLEPVLPGSDAPQAVLHRLLVLLLVHHRVGGLPRRPLGGLQLLHPHRLALALPAVRLRLQLRDRRLQLHHVCLLLLLPVTNFFQLIIQVLDLLLIGFYVFTVCLGFGTTFLHLGIVRHNLGLSPLLLLLCFFESCFQRIQLLLLLV